jgi:hypothetical protein
MRLTQFGHQVPRRNSTINVPRDRKPDSERMPSRFAAASKNSGARDPAVRVPVRSCILKTTLEHNPFGAACGKAGEPSEIRAGPPQDLLRLAAPRGVCGGQNYLRMRSASGNSAAKQPALSEVKAARECSPRRKPWVRMENRRAPARRKKDYDNRSAAALGFLYNRQSHYTQKTKAGKPSWM